jgi:hypothetical protein
MTRRKPNRSRRIVKKLLKRADPAMRRTMRRKLKADYLAANRRYRQTLKRARDAEVALEAAHEEIERLANKVRLQEHTIRRHNKKNNLALAKAMWHGPVRSAIDGRVYANPEDYAAHASKYGVIVAGTRTQDLN